MQKLIPLLLLLSTHAFADDLASPYGVWHGQTQYQAMLGPKPQAGAHAVVDLVLSMDSKGKIIGRSLGNGCNLLGISESSKLAATVELDITLTGCNFDDFNRNYKGRLSADSKGRLASFSLQTMDASTGRIATFNISSTLHR